MKIVGQPGAKIVKQELQKTKAEKSGPSAFEQKRVALEKQQSATANIPPEVQITPEQRKLLETNLRKHLEQGDAQDVLKVDLRQARTKLDGLTRQVTAAPKTPAMDAIRNRLNRIETQYLESDKLMKGLSGMESPRDMLNIQMKMYAMTQNIEIMSKVVEQGTSGVKDVVMHTQV